MLSYDLFFDVAKFLPIKNRGTLCCISKDGYRALSQSIPKFEEKVKENGEPAAWEWLDNEVDSTMFVTIARWGISGVDALAFQAGVALQIKQALKHKLFQIEFGSRHENP
ncbi:hypothetical protein Ddc_18880 [Ditylenchus destructor]|nr:hypothetical protein Ddc_18880 [Ditylenchus destructor]